MERFRDDDLAATLRALRPAPRSAFAAELDERAAAGFPRRSPQGSTPEGSAVERLLERVRALRPRQVLLPAGASAAVAIVLATAVVALNGGGSADEQIIDQVAAGHGNNAANEDAAPIVPFSEHSEAQVRPAGPEAEVAEGETGIELESGTSAGGVGQSTSSAKSTAEPPSSQINRNGSFAAKAPHRQVERSAEMTLGAEPAEVGEAAGRVFEAVHANNGIVLNSSIREGGEGDAGARFELLIPSGKLSDALADFSQIGEVLSRHEATADITAPTVTVGEQLRESRARIDGLLAQLAEADTESEREAVEAELHGERRRAARLKAQLANLDRRASLSRVQVRIETGAASSPSGDNSSWGIGDALHDAGRILGIAAAVTLVGLAVLAPIALIALLAWLAQRVWVRRERERTLG